KGIQVRLTHSGDKLRGSVANRLKTPFLHAVLMVNGAPYPLGDLAAGSTKPVDVAWRTSPPPPKPKASSGGAPGGGPGGMPGMPGMPAPDPAKAAAAEALVKALLPCPSKGFDADSVAEAVRAVVGAAQDEREMYMAYAYGRPNTRSADPAGTALWGWTDTVGGPLTPAGVRGQCQELSLLRVSFAPEQG
ncbi:MAG: hypothetical protein HYU66_01925, partial [Armatimonadetes bacterium]|nr:hypothetical protein [Armatimonadota bacterium]